MADDNTPQLKESTGSGQNVRKTLGALLPMAMEVILPVTSFFLTQKLVKSSLSKNADSTLTSSASDEHQHAQASQKDIIEQEERIANTAMNAGMAASIGVSSVVTWWLIKSLVKDPQHFKDEPLGKLMEWIKPGSADWLIGNESATEERQITDSKNTDYTR